MCSTPDLELGTDLFVGAAVDFDLSILDALVEQPELADANTATTTHPCDGVPIYPHGYSVRVAVDVTQQELAARLAVKGFPLGTPAWKTWESHGRRRHCLRGSKWVTERIAKTQSLPLHKANRAWRTRLYNLAVEVGQDKLSLDLQGVRHEPDVQRVLEDVLGFQQDQWRILHYRRAERFIVLMPHEAHRLADALGKQPQRGSGRLARKIWLARDHEIPITIRQRTKALAKLSIYKINNGATSPYKCELVLQGKSASNQHFQQADIEKLDLVLLDLVAQHSLHPIAKPARWQPCTGKTPAERGSFEPNIKKLGRAAYRGSKAATEALQAVVAVCHTPPDAEVVSFALDSQSEAFPPPPRPRIRFGCPGEGAIPTGEMGSPGGASLDEAAPPDGNDLDEGSHDFIPQEGELGSMPQDDEHTSRVGNDRSSVSPEGHLPWTLIEGGPLVPSLYISGAPKDVDPIWHPDAYERLASELALLAGALSEVILDPEVDPSAFLVALEHHVDDFAVISVAHPWNAWQSVMDAAQRHPGNDNTRTLVLVIDPTASCAVDSAVSTWDPDAEELLPGPLVRPDVPWVQDPLALTTKATAAWLWGLMRELREQACERAGGRVIVITTDARPDHGRGRLLRSHRFHDSRVRSWIGDAGRYWAHQRYHVEPGRRPRVVTWKDEAEGLTGREL